jgi:hypothetical protein
MQFKHAFNTLYLTFNTVSLEALPGQWLAA